MAREKVLLVRAPNLHKSESWKKQGVLRTPTNLAMLSSYIREHGNYEPEILDFERYDIKTIGEVVERISSHGARYVGFSTLTPRYPTILRICDALKKTDNGITTIVGGAHINGRPQDCKYDSIDYGITGEGEDAFLELLNCLASGRDVSRVENAVLKVNGQLKVNPRRAFIKNLDSLPFPAWDLLDLKEYTDPMSFDGPHVGVFTTRGCPHDCIFCASKVTWDKKMRYRSIDNVMSEFDELVHKWGIKNITFYDDQFAARPKRAIEFCNRIIDSGLGIKYNVQIRADSITPELAHALKASGCLSAALGVETGNEEMLRYIRKDETKEQIREAVRILKKEGLPCLTSYIIGLPGDTHETIKQTLDFARELDTEQMKFMLLTPVPGTEVHELAVRKKLLNPDDLSQMERTTYYDTTAVNLSDISVKDLLHYQDVAYAELDRDIKRA